MNLLSMLGLDESFLEELKAKSSDFIERFEKIEQKVDALYKKEFGDSDKPSDGKDHE